MFELCWDPKDEDPKDQEDPMDKEDPMDVKDDEMPGRRSHKMRGDGLHSRGRDRAAYARRAARDSSV